MKATVTHEYELPGEEADMRIQMLASDSYVLILNLDSDIHSAMKNEAWAEDSNVNGFLQDLRDMISASGIMQIDG